MPQQRTNAPTHVEAAVAAISDFHAEHHRNAGRIQRMVSATTSFLAKPRTLGVLTVAIAGWIALNLVLLVSGLRVLDGPPFPYLADAASILALYLTTVILITQRHDDDLATRRGQLTLEVAILGEQKITEILNILHQLQQGDPGIEAHGATDRRTNELARPQAMLDALQSAHQALDEPQEREVR